MARAATRDELTDTAADAAIDQACSILRLPTIRDRHGEAPPPPPATGQLQGVPGRAAVDRMRRPGDPPQGPAVREAAFPAEAAGGSRLRRQPGRARRADPQPCRVRGVAAGQPCCLSATGHRQVPPADRAGHRRRRERLPGPVRHRRRAGQRAGRAADDKTLSRTIARYGRVNLLCLDELGYLELDRRGAELLFQVFTEREERASIAIASNAAFSEWTSTFTDPRLCAAIVDRLTFDAHIITTGTDSYRLRTAQARHQAPRA